MQKRYYIYFVIIILLLGFLGYRHFIYRPELDFGKSGMIDITEMEKSEVKEEKPQIKSDYLPEDIPERVVETCKDYDFYYHWFLQPHKKLVIYGYTKDSKDKYDSHQFHKDLENIIQSEINDGNYKLFPVTHKAQASYQKAFKAAYPEFVYQPLETEPKEYQQEMLYKKSRIDDVLNFYKECAEGVCIIYGDREQYIYIDKRDIKVVKQVLNDYRYWRAEE